MSPQHCSLAYVDDMENEIEVFHDHINQSEPTLKLMRRSTTECSAMEDIVEFGGTITISF